MKPDTVSDWAPPPCSPSFYFCLIACTPVRPPVFFLHCIHSVYSLTTNAQTHSDKHNPYCCALFVGNLMGSWTSAGVTLGSQPIYLSNVHRVCVCVRACLRSICTLARAPNWLATLCTQNELRCAALWKGKDVIKLSPILLAGYNHLLCAAHCLCSVVFIMHFPAGAI